MPSSPRSVIRLFGLALCLACLSCATYNDRTRKAWNAFQRGELQRAEDLYVRNAGSEFLANAEAGMIALAAGDWEDARDRFERSIDEVESLEDRSLVDPRAVAEETLEWTLSPSVGPYLGEGYERVLVHVGLGLTYLAQGSVEGVLVECKRADDLLTTEEDLYRKKYKAGGMAHWLSAICYELLGERDEAYIDYERMHAKGLAPALVGPALVRLAQRLGYDEELPRWIDRYGEVEPLPEGQAQIIVLAGVGLGPFKEEARIDLPLPRGVFSAAVPQPRTRLQSVSSLILRRGEDQARTVVVEDVSRTLAANIEDRIGLLALRSTLRGTLKYLGTRELERQHGLIGLIIGSALSIATERADLRCWNTLPDTWQVARMHCEPGIQRLRLEAVGGDRLALGTFILDPGETMFIVARSVGPRLYAYPIGGLQADLEVLSQVDAQSSSSAEPEAQLP